MAQTSHIDIREEPINAKEWLKQKHIEWMNSWKEYRGENEKPNQANQN